LVAEVRRRKEAEPEIYNPIFAEASNLVHEARNCLIKGDWITVGKLMTKNHTLLQKVGVSIQELDKLVEIAISNGALGAKLTGGGGGGCMIALAPNSEIQNNIMTTINSAGYHAYTTTVG
jgi:mevalonate kinase